MTIVNTPVAPIAVDTSKSLGVQALAINAAANQLRTTIAGVWDLATTTSQPPAPDSTVVLKRVIPGQESVLDGDERTLVAEEHFAPGGKYRGIIKLMIKYAQKPNSMAHGTGWLIRPDLIATAGHNVYDWSHNAGQAIEIKCYAGWTGASRVNESVEFRRAARVVTTERWLQTRGSKAHDFALIQVEKPFTNVTPFSYIETPPFQANVRLGVVGYPAEARDERGERGARMYEMFLDTSYNLEKQADTMLEYSIDTEGGQSGSPILLETGLVAIGAHVYGGNLNAGSVLGRYGNPIQDYIAAVEIKLAHPGQINLFTIADDVVAAKGAATAKQSTTALTQLEGGDHIGTSKATNGPGPKLQIQEGIFDSVADILKVTSRANFLLGPIGGHISEIALMAIVAARAGSAESTFSTDTAKSGKVRSHGLPLADLQRAQLARANTTKLIVESAKANPEGFFDDVASTTTKAIAAPVSNATNTVVKMLTESVIGGAKAFADLVQSLTPTVAQSFLLAAALPTGAVVTESAMDSNMPENEKRFMAAFAESRRARQAQKTGTGNSGGILDDIIVAGVINAFAGGSSKTEGWFSTAAKLSQKGPNSSTKPFPEGFWDDLTQPFQEIGNVVKSGWGNGPDLSPVISGVAWVLPSVKAAESSIEESASFEEMIARITQAYVLRAAIEERYLVATMARPLEELKAEGWWDDMNDAIEGAVTGAATWTWDRIKDSAHQQQEHDQRQMDSAGFRIVTPMQP
ncbi:Serine protease [Cercospora zeina]